MRSIATLLILSILPGLGGCRTLVRQESWINSEAEISFSAAKRAWEIVADGRVVGSIVEFEESAGGRRFFSVRNTLQQELGLVDVHGRAWRYRAHIKEPEWLGTATVQHGARVILELESDPELYEISIQLLAGTLASH